MTPTSRAPADAAAGLDAFRAERPRLIGLAYRMTGSRTDADDIVQDAWLRWSGAERASIENPAAWLTTVTTRLALDRIRVVERRRETYVGPWLPEPVAAGRTPEQTAELGESLTLGFLIVLDQLAPVERAVFLLADVFGEPYATIAATVGKSEAACRQVASRARRKVREARPPTGAPDDPLLGELMLAVLSGDPAELMALLSPDVVLLSDGGPDRHAARRPVTGPYRVARLTLNLVKRLADHEWELRQLNGQPALVVPDHPDGPIAVWFGVADGRVVRIWSVLNPDKVAGLGEPYAGI